MWRRETRKARPLCKNMRIHTISRGRKPCNLSCFFVNMKQICAASPHILSTKEQRHDAAHTEETQQQQQHQNTTITLPTVDTIDDTTTATGETMLSRRCHGMKGFTFIMNVKHFTTIGAGATMMSRGCGENNFTFVVVNLRHITTMQFDNYCFNNDDNDFCFRILYLDCLSNIKVALQPHHQPHCPLASGCLSSRLRLYLVLRARPHLASSATGTALKSGH